MSNRIRAWARILLVGGAVVAVVVLFRFTGVGARLQDTLQAALVAIDELGAWGPVLFAAIYVLATVLLVPGSFLTIGAGAVFDVVAGTIVVSISSLLGATAAFLVGRYVARDWVRRRIEESPRFKAVDDAVAREGWKIVFLTRLSPVFPFVFLNYAYGLTSVSLRDYVVASWLGMIPGTLLYVYLGSLAGLAAVGSEEGHETTLVEWLLRGVGLLATVVVTVYLTWIARRALSTRLDGDTESSGADTDPPEHVAAADSTE